DLNKQDKYCKKNIIQKQSGKLIRSVLDVPFSNGVIAINSTKPNAFSKHEINILKQFAKIVSLTYTRVENLLKIEESEKRYHTLFNQAADAITLLDPETGAIVEFNEQTHKNLGYTRKEFEKLQIPDFEIIESKKQVQEHAKKVVKNGYDIFETKHKTKNGTIINVMVNSHAIQLQRKTFIQSIWRNITKRVQTENKLKQYQEHLEDLVNERTCKLKKEINKHKQTEKALTENEQKYRTLVESSLQGIAIAMGPSPRLVYVNHTLTKILGYTKEELVPSNEKKLKRLIHPKDQKTFFERFQKRFAGKQIKPCYEFRAICKDAKIRWLEMYCKKIKYNGQTAVLAIFIDITEHRKSEKTLEKTHRELKKVNENLETIVAKRTQNLHDINQKLNKAIHFKNKFIADASHELRTPLTIIKGNLDLIKRGDCKDIRNILNETEIISKEVDRIVEILSDLNILTRADSGEIPAKNEKLDFGILVKNVIQGLSDLAKSKKIKITSNLPPTSFYGDKEKIARLAYNLVLNAINYNNPNGWVKIYLVPEKNNLKLIVEDSGIGISKKDLPFIFERFYRVDKSRSHNIAGTKGTGLGLAICKWAVEAHNGKIEIASKINKGTIFTITLPR
ncbi:PAS domain-containing sensor histidine kinase, partial [Candidatus Falkowbacteria bacterium]|nr:PAS domain-containing sensor histidine kinase [Candidatus Falkowbacteria bacterium]